MLRKGLFVLAAACVGTALGIGTSAMLARNRSPIEGIPLPDGVKVLLTRRPDERGKPIVVVLGRQGRWSSIESHVQKSLGADGWSLSAQSDSFGRPGLTAVRDMRVVEWRLLSDSEHPLPTPRPIPEVSGSDDRPVPAGGVSPWEPVIDVSAAIWRGWAREYQVLAMLLVVSVEEGGVTPTSAASSVP